MYFSKTIAAAATSILFAQSVAGLGINCRGSGLCPLASFDNKGSVDVLQGLRDAMYYSNVTDGAHYNDGDHIICVTSQMKIDITPSVGASADGASASVSVGLSGNIGDGGICVFPQNTGGGVTLGQAKGLIDGILNHGCNVCGSIPTTPGNNVKNGQLTVNYVKAPSCTGNCLSTGGGQNPTAPVGKRDFAIPFSA